MSAEVQSGDNEPKPTLYPVYVNCSQRPRGHRPIAVRSCMLPLSGWHGWMQNANMLPRIRLADDVANASYKITDDVLARSLSSLLEGNKEGEEDKGVKVSSAAPAASGRCCCSLPPADDTFLIASSNFSPRKPTLGFSLFPSLCLLSKGGNAGSSFSPDFLDVQQ